MKVTRGSARRSGERRAGLGVVVICAAHFLIGVDGLAVAIALPAVQRDLGVAAIEGQWVLSAYGLAFGGMCCSVAASAISTVAVARWWPDSALLRPARSPRALRPGWAR